MEDKFLKVKGILEQYHQEHLLNHYNNLDDIKKEELLNQILEIDFELLNKLYERCDMVENSKDEIKPIPYIDKSKLSEEELSSYIKKERKL